MIAEPIKTVDEYTKDFKTAYDTIVNYGNGYNLINPVEPGQKFEIFTLYTDKTPVTASNSSQITNL